MLLLILARADFPSLLPTERTVCSRLKVTTTKQIITSKTDFQSRIAKVPIT